MPEVEPSPEPTPNSSPMDPQALLAGLSITDMESNVEALMNDRMSQLDEMLDGLDQLVARIEGEMGKLESLEDPPQ